MQNNRAHAASILERKSMHKRDWIKTMLALVSSTVLSQSNAAKPPSKSTYFPMLGRPWLTPAQELTIFDPLQTNLNITNANVSVWMERCITLIQKYQLNLLRAIRALAYISVAMHDAAVGGHDSADAELASSIAAGLILMYLFPEEPRNAFLNPSQATPAPEIVNKALQAVESAIQRASFDKSDHINSQVLAPKDIPLSWSAAPPLWNSYPAEPGAQNWTTWCVDSAIADQVPLPPQLDAVQYAKEMAEVLKIQTYLFPMQKQIALDWTLDAGTATLGGVWMKKLLALPNFKKLTHPMQTTVCSQLATTMQDALIACWRVKFTWWTERPITAIVRELEKNFLPFLSTPNFPSYVSGYATISGAAAQILAYMFPLQRPALMRDAQEATLSRLYGGIHFRSDNEEGLKLGFAVADKAWQTFKENT